MARGPVTNVHLLPAWRAISLITQERQITKVRSCYLNVVISQVGHFKVATSEDLSKRK